MKPKVNRRDFLKASATLAASVGLPGFAYGIEPIEESKPKSIDSRGCHDFDLLPGGMAQTIMWTPNGTAVSPGHERGAPAPAVHPEPADGLLGKGLRISAS